MLPDCQRIARGTATGIAPGNAPSITLAMFHCAQYLAQGGTIHIQPPSARERCYAQPEESAQRTAFGIADRLHQEAIHKAEHDRIAADSAHEVEKGTLRRQIAAYRADLRRAGLDIAELRNRPLDTVYVPVQVLIRADSVERACIATESACEVAKQALRKEKAEVEDRLETRTIELAETRKQVLVGWRHVAHDAKVVGVTAGTTYAIVRLLQAFRVIP